MRRRFDFTPTRLDGVRANEGLVDGPTHVGSERRAVSRLAVDLEAAWRPLGETRPPQLIYVTDLSARGARVATWHSTPVKPGDRLEMHAGGQPFEVTVRRVLGHCEFGVEFTGLTSDQRMRLVRTIGNNRVSPGGWA